MNAPQLGRLASEDSATHHMSDPLWVTSLRTRILPMPDRPLKNKSLLRGSSSIVQMSMGINMGFLNDRT
jgi:hypothetical protein